MTFSFPLDILFQKYEKICKSNQFNNKNNLSNKAKNLPIELIFSNVNEFLGQHFKQDKKLSILQKINEIFNESAFCKLIRSKTNKQTLSTESKTQDIQFNHFKIFNKSTEKKLIKSDELFLIFIFKIFNFFLLESLKVNEKSNLHKKIKNSICYTSETLHSNFIEKMIEIILDFIVKCNSIKNKLFYKKINKSFELFFKFFNKSEFQNALKINLLQCKKVLKLGVLFFFKNQQYDKCFDFINTGFKIINTSSSSKNKNLKKIYKIKKKIKKFFQNVLIKLKDLRNYQIKKYQKTITIMQTNQELNMLKFDETNKHSKYYEMLLVNKNNKIDNVNNKKRSKILKKYKRKSSSEHSSESCSLNTSYEFKSSNLSIKKRAKRKKTNKKSSLKNKNLADFLRFSSDNEITDKLKTKKNFSTYEEKCIKDVINIYRSEDSEFIDSDFQIMKRNNQKKNHTTSSNKLIRNKKFRFNNSNKKLVNKTPKLIKDLEKNIKFKETDKNVKKIPSKFQNFKSIMKKDNKNFFENFLYKSDIEKNKKEKRKQNSLKERNYIKMEFKTNLDEFDKLKLVSKESLDQKIKLSKNFEKQNDEINHNFQYTFTLRNKNNISKIKSNSKDKNKNNFLENNVYSNKNVKINCKSKKKSSEKSKKKIDVISKKKLLKDQSLTKSQFPLSEKKSEIEDQLLTPSDKTKEYFQFKVSKSKSSLSNFGSASSKMFNSNKFRSKKSSFHG